LRPPYNRHNDSTVLELTRVHKTGADLLAKISGTTQLSNKQNGAVGMMKYDSKTGTCYSHTIDMKYFQYHINPRRVENYLPDSFVIYTDR
jgi:hypothetical protein